MDRNQAEAFARDWAAAWNDKDLDSVLAHYADDVVFRSPRIALVTGETASSVSGKTALRAYWEKALALAPDLYFEVDQIFLGADALTILYTNHREQQVAETFVFGPDGKVTESVAAYA